MNLALFDFDGTVTFSDTFTPFLYFGTRRARVVGGTLLLSPVILGYKLGVVPTSRMRQAAAHVCFRGRSVTEVRELGARYAATLPRVVRPQALERIQWHQSQGDTVVVVSASLDMYLEPWCAVLGLDLLCSTLEAQNGVFTGRYSGGDCTGSEKARRVRARYDVSSFQNVFAYGDTEEDRELLDLASQRFFRWQPTPKTA